MECLKNNHKEGVILDGRFKTIQPLNHGSFGMVYLALDLTTNQKVAVKILTKKSAIPDGENANFAIDDGSEELACHRLLGAHKNTVNLIHNWETEHHVYLALEFCEHGDLYEAIRTGCGPIGTEAVRTFMLELVSAVEYMHSCGLSHRDIKPENIFLCADGTLKLGDFGLATQDKWCYDTSVGSDRYMAPEQYDSAGAGYSPAEADIWAIGVILLNILFTKNPFTKPTMDDSIFLDYSRDSESLFDVFIDMSRDTYEVILGCMNLDPRKRSLQRVREALNNVENFSETIDDDDDYRSPIRQPALVTANREPLRTPTIKSPTLEAGGAFPWQKALEAYPAKPVRQLSVIPDTETYSEDLFSKTGSSQDWSSVATPGTSMMDSQLGASIFSSVNGTRPTLGNLPRLAPVSGSVPINMLKSKAMASVFGKKETVAKSWSDMFDEDEEEELMERKLQNNARTFSHDEIKIESDETAIVFEDDEETTVLAPKKASTVNVIETAVEAKVEHEHEEVFGGNIDDENCSDPFFQAGPKAAEPVKSSAIYSPPPKRASDATDKWAALGARRRGYTGESMEKPPTSWRENKKHVGMGMMGNGISLSAGVRDYRPAATGGVYNNINTPKHKAMDGRVRSLDQKNNHYSPLNKGGKARSSGGATFSMRLKHENAENIRRGAPKVVEEDLEDLEWVGGWRDKVGGLQL